MKMILASTSPRRIELMKILCGSFEVIPSGADETVSGNMAPGALVELLSRRKAEAIRAVRPEALVIGADTIVTIDGEVLGKPAGREDAARMLRKLSNRVHEVYTGVALIAPGKSLVFHVRTEVRFYPLDEETVRWYLDTGEPFDKAGAYGIQQKGALLVREIRGDYFNVMGFPVAEVSRGLKRLLSHEDCELEEFKENP